jgi:hypothetical protein
MDPLLDGGKKIRERLAAGFGFETGEDGMAPQTPVGLDWSGAELGWRIVRGGGGRSDARPA